MAKQFLRDHFSSDSELYQINLLPLPLKSPEKHTFSDDLRGKRS